MSEENTAPVDTKATAEEKLEAYKGHLATLQQQEQAAKQQLVTTQTNIQRVSGAIAVLHEVLGIDPAAQPEPEAKETPADAPADAPAEEPAAE